MSEFTLLRLTLTVCAILMTFVGVSLAEEPASLVANSSYVAPSGERVLQHEVTLPAPIDSVWWALTTTQGVKTWMVPVASIELKTGGLWETNYDPAAKLGDSTNIRNTVLSYIPNRMISFKIGLTKNFPAGPREAGTLFCVITFEDLGADQTRVVTSMLGWKEGPEWDDVYQKFAWGNDYTMKKLHERFTKGPTVWQPKAAN